MRRSRTAVATAVQERSIPKPAQSSGPTVHKARPASGPDVDPIDPAGKDARRRLEARFPGVAHDVILSAPPELERHAVAYLRANAEIATLEDQKETAGNTIRAAIGGARGVEGATFVATWETRAGSIDVQAVAEAYGIPESELERFRRPGGRVLRVQRRA